ncbi:GIY-YIG nuclease family protein [Burkholderia contaminans]|uniref:GIY-YIG nuclease family protein n=1 Tax=Burkholderia contaminans TaxID=488447 RepID=UPI0015893FAA|nr:GIY-YIG nuclease family protein [Burkholderia contaminans]
MAINKNWRDEFNEDDYDDFKSSQVGWERLRQENSDIGWIYIARNIRNPHEAKVGKTTIKLGTRASSTGNPYYALLCAFKIKEGVSPDTIEAIEKSTHRMLDENFERIYHVSSGEKSEWFIADPFEVKEMVHDFLYNNHGMHMHCYHCSGRDIGVIYSWENNSSINEGRKPPYQATDCSNPPVSFECFAPPGCGSGCDCW